MTKSKAPFMTRGTNRRTILKTGAGLAGLAAAAPILGAPALASKRSIKVGSYGGYFEDSFKKHVYPEFTKATGIEVESVTQPNSADWLVTMQRALRACLYMACTRLLPLAEGKLPM